MITHINILCTLAKIENLILINLSTNNFQNVFRKFTKDMEAFDILYNTLYLVILILDMHSKASALYSPFFK